MFVWEGDSYLCSSVFGITSCHWQNLKVCCQCQICNSVFLSRMLPSLPVPWLQRLAGTTFVLPHLCMFLPEPQSYFGSALGPFPTNTMMCVHSDVQHGLLIDLVAGWAWVTAQQHLCYLGASISAPGMLQQPPPGPYPYSSGNLFIVQGVRTHSPPLSLLTSRECSPTYWGLQ